MTVTGAVPGDLVLAVSDEHATACRVLGAPRVLASPPVGQGPHRYVWVVDFPMFEGYGADGHLQPAHHPFTMPYPEDLPLLSSDPLAVRSQAYDLVLNGWSSARGASVSTAATSSRRCSAHWGSTRTRPRPGSASCSDAFRYGAPPHAGFAFGVDRLAAILAGEENIREVIVYPKTQSGADPLTGAPTPLPAASLAELGIRVVAPPAVSGQGGAERPTPRRADAGADR